MNEHVRHIDAAPALAPDEPHRTRRVVFLGTAHDNGGSSVLAGNLAQAMRAQGYEVEEWYLFASPADPKTLAFFRTPDGRGRLCNWPDCFGALCGSFARANRTP